MRLLHTVYQCTNSYYYYSGVSCPLISRDFFYVREVSPVKIIWQVLTDQTGRGHEVRLMTFSQTCSAFSPNDFSMLNLRCCNVMYYRNMLVTFCTYPVKCAYRSELGLTCHLMRSIGYQALDFLQLQIHYIVQ
jgi:hypothetical protein